VLDLVFVLLTVIGFAVVTAVLRGTERM